MPARKPTHPRKRQSPDSARQEFGSENHFYHQLLESLEDYVIFTTDTKGIVNTWNHGAEKIFGYREKDIIGKNAEILYTTEDRKTKKPEKELLTAKQKGKAVNERWHVRKDSTHFWGSGLVFPLRDEAGEIRGFTKVMRDLTERMQGIERIRQSEERYRAFIKNSTEGIWRFELEKPLKTSLSINRQISHFYQYAYLAEANDSMAVMYGYKKADEIIGKRLADLLIRDDKQNITYLKAFIQSGYRLTEVESHEKDKSGYEKYFLNNLIGIVQDGFLHRAWGTQRDITEQKHMMESQTQLASIVESSEDAILARTFDGTILSWNKGAEKIFGYKAEEVLGKNVNIFVPPGREEEITKIHKITKEGQHLNHFETIRMNKKGELVNVSISLSPVYNNAGEITGISAISRDITNRIQLERQKDDFIGIASHELKTPVTSVKAYTQVLMNRFAKKGDKTSVDLLAKMDTQIDKLNNLIGDLLDVTKIETGSMQFHQGYFDFNDLVEEIIEEMQRTTKNHSIELKLEKTKSVYGDRDRIGQVIMNLLSNAIKYSPDSKKIIVRSEFEKDSVTLCIQDFGVGIAKEKQDHVFERFFRVSGPQENTFPGMGLGLYISSEIIKRQGGRIWVESHKGKGSTFCFSLPIKSPKKNIPLHTEQRSGVLL
jgi:PAS domain S-box-containing protein